MTNREVQKCKEWLESHGIKVRVEEGEKNVVIQRDDGDDSLS